MSAIFISYRRQDAIKDARAVFERLRREFGAGQVFMDLEGLAFGEDFEEALDRHLAGCQAVLALIGPKWLTVCDAQGQRRLDDPDDFVRIELRTTLARQGVRVVPVLLDGAELPLAAELPEDLRSLRRRQALVLRDASFDGDMRHLCAGLRQVLQAPSAGGDGPAQAPATRADAAPTWASAQGDDAYGRWAEFKVGDALQRLRWIEPGEFNMGSPAGERDRLEFEDPQHRVRLTQGFWLADTACTQALWLAVMGGSNPARFQDDPQNPVEQVSHEDVTAFLTALRERLTGRPEAVLPTEAQWEYACRAGTATPFSFGPTITTAQVNFDGKHPYAGAPQGEYRQRTVPVKALPANRWGLYQMHGNVWEWCADGLRTYRQVPDGRAAENPSGPQEPGPEAYRVIRGGSWFDVARYARSAYRDADLRGARIGFLGFRLALRS